MICGFCSESLDGRPEVCPACGQPPLLDGRYRLDTIVGRGAMGVTYRAERLDDGREVAIKELPFRRIDAVKTKALFEREARVLEQLDHPGIPAYLDDFLGGVGKHQSLYLVQAFVDGETLAARQAQERWREDEVLRLMAQVGDILTYLHELSPPVIHRDIKPGNIMCRPDGSLALIDFGAVRDAIDDDQLGGSTVVGTYGFMAPEQFKGDATPATDLYGFGVTLVALLSRRAPDEMVDVSGRLAWQSHVQVDRRTHALLAELLDVDPSKRPRRTRDVARRCRAIADAIEAGRAAPRPAPNAPNAPVVQAVVPPRPRVFDDAPPVHPPAHQQRRAAMMVIAGAFVVAMTAGVAITLLAGSDGPRGDSNEARCGGQPCPPVAQGLKGLRFGMNRTEAAEVLPALAQAHAEKIRGEANAMLLLSGRLGGAPTLPGFKLSVPTTLIGLPATCTLYFADQERLSRMNCGLKKQPNREAHVAAEQALVAALTKRYGPPTSTPTIPEHEFSFSARDRAWGWEDPEARLTVTSHFQDFSGMIRTVELAPESSIEVENSGQAQWRIESEARDESRRAADAERARKAERDRAAAEAARKAIEKSLTDDL